MYLIHVFHSQFFSLSACVQREFHLDQDMVFNQLQPLRVLDTALIQGCGYPVHVSHAAFTERYAAAVLKINRAEPSSESCSRILTVAGLDDWQIGTTKVRLIQYTLYCKA